MSDDIDRGNDSLWACINLERVAIISRQTITWRGINSPFWLTSWRRGVAFDNFGNHLEMVVAKGYDTRVEPLALTPFREEKT